MPSPDAADYLDRALDILERYSLHRSEIDWPRFRGATVADADAATTIEDTYPALRDAVSRLGDGHSSFVTAAQMEEHERSFALNPTVSAAQRLSGPIGYLRVPSFPGAQPELASRFAQQTQDLIREIDGNDLTGWVVDLRQNGGGNMWPMFAGLGPLLGDGRLGAFVFPDGRTQDWFYRDGAAGFDGEHVLPPPRGRLDLYSTRVTAPYLLRRPNPPVAVLNGAKTASAAESVALAFRGPSRSRSFGSPTAGLTTAVGMVELSDGALIFLAVARDADRTGRQFPSGIPPDEEVADNKATALADDDVVRAASEWLRQSRA
jgi:carboxyl-terminal processing protease